MIYFAPYGTAWTLRGMQLVDRATGQYRVTPTLAAGDVKIEKDGGAAANVATLPSAEPAGGSSLKVPFSIEEMQCKQAVVRFVDAAGAEWNDGCLHIFTVGHPSAFMQFDLFAATVALSPGSLSQVTGGVWAELRENHTVAGTFGERGLSAADISALLSAQIGDGTLTLSQAIRVFLASLAGTSAGANGGPSEITFNSVDGTVSVIVAQVDAFGNRQSVTLTL